MEEYSDEFQPVALLLNTEAEVFEVIEDLVSLFNNLEEIRKTFNFQIGNFTQLNEIFWEFNTIKKRLNFPEEYSITDVMSRINFQLIPNLGLDETSLLKRLLQLYLPRLNQSI